MSVCRKLPDGTIQKIAGHTILLDANASEVRQGTFTMSGIGSAGGNVPVTKDVTFSDPMPDTDYVVIIETETASYEPGAYTPYLISGKTVTGFHVAMWFHEDAATEITQTCRYTAWKPVKIEGYTALQNKINNPDDTPTIDSMNLVTSDGVARAIENASAVFTGTSAEWALETQTDYDIAVLTDVGLVVAVDRMSGANTEAADLSKVWTGTQSEWDALSTVEKDKWEKALIKDDEYTSAMTVKILTATLTAGATSLTFIDPSIRTTSLINVYADGMSLYTYTSMTVHNGDLVIGFPVQTANVSVTIRVENYPV